MIDKRNGSDTLVVLLHEIYGINRHMAGLSEFYAAAGFDVICPDLLNRKTPFDYAEEVEAYSRFMEVSGFTGAALRASKLVAENRSDYKSILVCGFSAGATAAWLCSSDSCCDGVICYYGSRIRDYTEKEPQCPALLLFARQEKSFDVLDTLKILSIKKNVTARIFDGTHGFADPFSSSCDSDSYREARETEMKFIHALSASSNVC